MKATLLKHNNKVFKIHQFEYETPEIFEIRSQWILRKNPYSTPHLHSIVKQSKFLYNILMFNCSYPDFIIDDPVTQNILNEA